MNQISLTQHGNAVKHFFRTPQHCWIPACAGMTEGEVPACAGMTEGEVPAICHSRAGGNPATPGRCSRLRHALVYKFPNASQRCPLGLREILWWPLTQGALPRPWPAASSAERAVLRNSFRVKDLLCKPKSPELGTTEYSYQSI